MSQIVDQTGRSSPKSIWRWMTRLASYVPTALVLSALAIVAYFGHRHDWKLPSAFALQSSDKASDALDWCMEHGVAEEQCVECRPDLLPKPQDFGWCKEHGVSQCTFCHPEIAQVKEVATVFQADLERARRALSLRARPENNPKCVLYRRRLQFASLNAVKKAGIDVDVVDRAAIDESVTANGEITYDQTRVAHLPAKSPGSVFRVDRKIGDHVRAGDVLALVDAADVGRAKAEFLEAMAKWEFSNATKQRLSPLSEQGTVTSGRLLEVETAIREAWSRVVRAQQALVNLGLPLLAEQLKGHPADAIAAELQFAGLPKQLTESLDPKVTTSNLLAIRAPFDSVIIDTDMVSGEVVDITKPLFTLADTTRMWLTLDVPAEEADYVAVGQRVYFRPSGSQGTIEGRIEWISTEANAQTRTVKVRAALDNDDGKLRDSTFGTGQIVLRSEADAIVIPKESLQWDGSCHVVFVRDKDFFVSEQSPKLFYPRPVQLGARTDNVIEVLAGVLPGEIVVTQGSGALRAELLKNNLGAG